MRGQFYTAFKKPVRAFNFINKTYNMHSFYNTRFKKKNFFKYGRKSLRKSANINSSKNKKKSFRALAFGRLFSFNLIFMRKLFSMFIKTGLKQRVINFYIIFVATINRRVGYKKILFNIYLTQIVKNIMPLVHNTAITKRGEKISLPWFIKNKKKRYKRMLSLSCGWVKKAVIIRKEKTLFLRIISELESIRKLNNSQALVFKNEYYNNFYKNKYYTKFLKKRDWI